MYRTNALIASSTPRSPSIALGVAALVFTGVVGVGSIGFVAYRLGAKKNAPSATPEAPVSATPEAPVSTTPVATPASPPIVPDDDAVPAPMSVEASRHARPSWSDASAFAPQPSQPLEVFLRAAPIAGEITNAYVLCRFQSFNQADTFAGDDLHVRAKLGAMPEVTANGPEDANLGFAGAPLVSLRKDTPVHFEVYDRDVFGMTLLTRTTVPFPAAPFTSVDSGAAIECRALAGAPLVDAVRSYARTADHAIAKVAHEKIDPYSSDWSAAPYGLHAAQNATSDVAALAGWADPRVVKRVGAIDAVLADHAAQRTRVFATLHEAARDRVTFDRFDVRLGAVDCTDDACTVHLSVTNHGREPMSFGAFLSPYAYVADATSGPLRANGGGDIPAGETRDLAVTSSGAHLEDGPSIAGICNGSRCAPLRIR